MKITPQTIDQAAIAVLLSNLPQASKQRTLSALADNVTQAVQRRHACPDCGSTSPKEDNGLCSTDYDFSLLCVDCGESWSPNAG